MWFLPKVRTFIASLLKVVLKSPHFIINPTASAGRTGRSQARLLRVVEEYFPDGFTLDVTTRIGHATEITANVLDNGADLVVAVGGDGTMNEIVNGFFADGKLRRKSSSLGVLSSGTAEDVSRNLSLPHSLRDQIALLAGKRRRKVDVGRVVFRTKGGQKQERYFVNECQPGIAARVVRHVTPALKRLGGFLAFGLVSTYVAVTYRGRHMAVTVDGRQRVEGRFLGVTVANGRYAGGGMDFAPASKIDDGMLDVVMIHDMAVPSRLMNFPKMYSGKHVGHSWITMLRGKHVSVESNDRVAIEADGELLGFLPCEIDILPSALSICSL